MCGENLSTDTEDVILAGSSPRVRGKQGSGGPRPPELRLIPACAGKTGAMDFVLGHLPAHPRVCGENLG